MVRSIYVAIKQVSEVFLKQERTVFKKVVLVEYPRPGIYVIGFVTSTWRFKGADGVRAGFRHDLSPDDAESRRSGSSSSCPPRRGDSVRSLDRGRHQDGHLGRGGRSAGAPARRAASPKARRARDGDGGAP